jgi:hypothetical protein
MAVHTGAKRKSIKFLAWISTDSQLSCVVYLTAEEGSL